MVEASTFGRDAVKVGNHVADFVSIAASSIERRIGLYEDIMLDGEGTSSLPWRVTGCMTYRAEIKKAVQCRNKQCAKRRNVW